MAHAHAGGVHHHEHAGEPALGDLTRLQVQAFAVDLDGRCALDVMSIRLGVDEVHVGAVCDALGRGACSGFFGQSGELVVREACRVLFRLVREHRVEEVQCGVRGFCGDAVHRAAGAGGELGVLRQPVQDRHGVDVQRDVAVGRRRLQLLAVRLLEVAADRAHEVDVRVDGVLAVAEYDGPGLLVDDRTLRRGAWVIGLVVEDDHECAERHENDDDRDRDADREPVGVALCCCHCCSFSWCWMPRARKNAVGDASIVPAKSMHPL